MLGPNGELALIQPDTGVAKIQITNLHGDVVTQLDNTTGAPVIDAYTETTEYGLPKPDTEPTDQHYGWLGAHRRSTDSLAGLTLMGVRLYNPTTARFLSTDPIPGGNDNPYTYPTDPINTLDLDGRFSFKSIKRFYKRHKTAINIGLTVASFATPGLGAAVWAVRGYKAAKVIRGVQASRRTSYSTYKVSSGVAKRAGKMWTKDGRKQFETSYGTTGFRSINGNRYRPPKPHKKYEWKCANFTKEGTRLNYHLNIRKPWYRR